jgi:hypothetical protein
MAQLVLGGQPREIRFEAADLDAAERFIMRNGGRAIMEVLGHRGGLFTQAELVALLWGAWRRTLSYERVTQRVAQFLREGSTLIELQAAIGDALMESGVYVKREAADPDAPAAPPVDGDDADRPRMGTVTELHPG